MRECLKCLEVKSLTAFKLNRLTCKDCLKKEAAYLLWKEKQAEKNNPTKREGRDSLDLVFVLQNLSDKLTPERVLAEVFLTPEEVRAINSGVFSKCQHLLDLHLEHCPKDHNSAAIFLYND